MVKNGYYSFTRTTPEAFEELRVLLSNRDFVVKRLVSVPELRQVFKDLMCAGSFATFRLFPTTAELGELQPQDLIRGWKSLMKRHYGERKARTLILLAGSRHAMQAYKLHLKQLLVE